MGIPYFTFRPDTLLQPFYFLPPLHLLHFAILFIFLISAKNSIRHILILYRQFFQCLNFLTLHHLFFCFTLFYFLLSVICLRAFPARTKTLCYIKLFRFFLSIPITTSFPAAPCLSRMSLSLKNSSFFIFPISSQVSYRFLTLSVCKKS